MVDTHAHLNFKRLVKDIEAIRQEYLSLGVEKVIIPGTDITSSVEAVRLSQLYPEMSAAVGIHPHHVFEVYKSDEDPHERCHQDIAELEKLCNEPNVVAIGEIGIDCHEYAITKYQSYTMSNEFTSIQKYYFEKQLLLARDHDLPVILHNREAAEHTLATLSSIWEPYYEGRFVFHCCEPSEEILTFTEKHAGYIGVDGDVTYWSEKQEFIREVPLEMLLLETDSPFLLPEPLRSEKKFPNTPRTIPLIAQKVAELKQISVDEVVDTTSANARELFGV